MSIAKQLSLLAFIVICFSTASCQSKRKATSDNETKTLTKNLQEIRQTIWDNFPQPHGHVNDYEDLFSSKEEETLDSLITDYDERTTIQIALITFDTLMTSIDSLDALTLRIAKKWGVGQKEKNNGVTIGICNAYRKIRIQNGYGIENILSDAETKEIMDNDFIPLYRQGNYYEGTLNGLKALMKILEEKSK